MVRAIRAEARLRMGRRIVLEGTELSLAEVVEDDVERIRIWRNQQIRVLRQKAPITREDQRAYWARVRDREDLELFSLLTRTDGQHVGYCGLTNIVPRARRAEVSFLLETSIEEGSDRYREYFADALRMLVRWAFAQRQLHRLFTETYAFRSRHMDVLEGVGFRREGVLRDHVYEDGQYHDSIIHGLLAEEGHP